MFDDNRRGELQTTISSGTDVVRRHTVLSFQALEPNSVQSEDKCLYDEPRNRLILAVAPAAIVWHFVVGGAFLRRGMNCWATRESCCKLGTHLGGKSALRVILPHGTSQDCR